MRALLTSSLVLLAAGCVQAPGFHLESEGLEGGALLSAWSNGDSLVAVGGQLDGSDGLLVQQTEGCWDTMDADTAPRPVWWLHGARAGEWFAVGDAGLVLHGGAFGLVDESLPTDSTLFGVWDDGERVWAVGGDVFGSRQGEIWTRVDGAWEVFAGELPHVVFKVWNGWFVGDGVIYHLEDGELVDRTPPEQPRLLTVRGRGPDDVWAVGGEGRAELWHWNGDEWTRIDVSPACATLPLNGVWTAPGEDVWVAGMQGAMGRFDGEAWECPERPLTYDDLHAVWRHGEDMFWFGGNLMSSTDNHGTVLRYGVPGGSTTAACE